MTKTDALAVADTLKRARPDQGNKYEPRHRLVLKRGAFRQWQETCRTFGYALCVSAKIVTESEFYAACDYDGKSWREGG